MPESVMSPNSVVRVRDMHKDLSYGRLILERLPQIALINEGVEGAPSVDLKEDDILVILSLVDKVQIPHIPCQRFDTVEGELNAFELATMVRDVTGSETVEEAHDKGRAAARTLLDIFNLKESTIGYPAYFDALGIVRGLWQATLPIEFAE